MTIEEMLVEVLGAVREHRDTPGVIVTAEDMRLFRRVAPVDAAYAAWKAEIGETVQDGRAW